MIEDRDEENEEGIEAMTRALTNHSVAWWEMRKKQLPQKNNHRIVVENNNGMGVVPINYDKGGGGNDEDDDYDNSENEEKIKMKIKKQIDKIIKKSYSFIGYQKFSSIIRVLLDGDNSNIQKQKDFHQPINDRRLLIKTVCRFFECTFRHHKIDRQNSAQVQEMDTGLLSELQFH